MQLSMPQHGSAAMVSESLYHALQIWSMNAQQQSKLNDFSSRATRREKWTTERHWDRTQNCSGVLDFLGRQENVEIEI